MEETHFKSRYPIQCNISLNETTSQPVCIQRKTKDGWKTISGTYEKNELLTWLFETESNTQKRIPSTNELYCESKFKITSCIETHPEAFAHFEELIARLP